MNELDTVALSESESTGLPWPKTWRGTYVFVLCSFALWLVLLIALTECGT
ncbi:MAG: hypothetical protein KGS72_15795 [Cyanobacteria bacterium REEB67]|nr:hypothetical protein [Cyanobacteria bacterium REEB67]